jgi:hypothetical protein
VNPKDGIHTYQDTTKGGTSLGMVQGCPHFDVGVHGLNACAIDEDVC